MDNTNSKDKKQPMSDEELAKISGGHGRREVFSNACPYCYKDFGIYSQERIEAHLKHCPLNPNK